MGAPPAQALASTGVRLIAPMPARSLLNLQRADLIVPKPTPWLMEGWLVENTLAGLVAASGACKSFLAIDWACCVATGTPWNGFPVKAGAVCYLAGEGQDGLRKRIAAWEHQTGVSITGKPLYLSAGLPFLCNDTNAVASIEEMNDATLAGPSLIVVDTVARAMGGSNENSAEDMSWLIRSMDWMRQECGATVLAVHHTGHEGSRARGSSAFHAALDSEFLMKGNSAGEVELAASKCKDWATPDPMRFRKQVVPLEVAGEPSSSLVLRHLTGLQVEIDKRPRALELHAEGLTVRQIAAELGIGKSTVDRWLKPFTRDGSDCPVPPIYTDGAGGTTVPRDKTAGTERDRRDSSDYRRAADGE